MKAFDLRRQTSLLFLILSMGLLLFSSCRKYPDGPTWSLRSRVERVSNFWTASVISRNTINETNTSLIYTMERLSFSFDIRRLEENEMWLQFIRFGDEWDIQLVD